MPRGQAGRKSQTDHDECINGRYLGRCLARDTRCLCATGTAPEYRWGAGIVLLLATVWATLACGWFRLWRTPPGVGNADGWVCVVLSCKGRKLKPEGRKAGGTTRRKATLTGAIAPTKPLTALDVCDRCGAQAYVRVLLANSGELLFCAHHGRQHAERWPRSPSTYRTRATACLSRSRSNQRVKPDRQGRRRQFGHWRRLLCARKRVP